MRRFWKFSFLALLLFLVASCTSEQAQPIVAENEQPPEPKTKDIIAEWRKDLSSGEGGQFAFNFDGEDHNVEWGYADFRFFSGSSLGKLTLLSNPRGGQVMPLLRILVEDQSETVDQLVGKTLESESFNLKFEKKKKSGMKGTGTVTIEQIESDFIIGSFKADFEGKGLEGTFKAKLHIAE